MSNAMKVAIRQRAMALTRLQEIYDYGVNNTTDEFYADNFLARVEFIETIYGEFQTSHNLIIGNLTDDEFDAADQFRKSSDNYFYGARMLGKRLLDAAMAQKTPPTPVVVPNTSPYSRSNIRMPEFNVPVFDGNPSDWPSFFDLYRNAVHNKTHMSDAEKFQYLMTLLKGEPLRLIRMTPITDANYTIAFNALVKRYQDRRFLATSYFEKIYHFSPLVKPTAQTLRVLVDTFNENVGALRNLNFPVDEWDFLLFNILLDKLDLHNKTDFELLHTKYPMPTYTQLIEHLEERCKVFLSTEIAPSTHDSQYKKPLISGTKPKNLSSTFVTSVDPPRQGNNLKCHCCGSQHPLSKCTVFLAKQATDRFQLIKQKKLCINCMRQGHSVSKCSSLSRCRQCNGPHHSLLHFERYRSDPQNASQVSKETSLVSTPVEPTSAPLTLIAPVEGASNMTILLSTALIEIRDVRGNYQQIRVLLDTASMANFITESCINKLGLKRFSSTTIIEGLNSHSANINNGFVQCHIRPRILENPLFTINAIILPRICSDLPKVQVDRSKLHYLDSLNLADTGFYKPGPIDMLIGAELFPQILLSNRIMNEPNQPIALETLFGYILQGKAKCCSSSNNTVSCCTTFTDVDTYTLLQNFWDLEKVPEHVTNSSLDVRCEQIYKDTTYRLDTGHFVVSLPFKIKCPDFGNSYSQALRRFNHLESRFYTNSTLHTLYSQVIKEHIAKNYISPVPLNDYASDSAFYLPHHGILKTGNATTKLRVVLDASAKGSKGLSLNDALFAGPKLQQDLVKILLNFRTFTYVFICDIKQMFLQIFVNPSDINYQRFLWRFSREEKLTEYYLNRVTFGVSASPYLALRTLKELAFQDGNKFPLAAEVLSHSIYVDDCVYGADTVEMALKVQQELINLLKKGGFELGKWASNNNDILSAVTVSENPNICNQNLTFDKEGPLFVKVLGLQWSPKEDIFSYSFSICEVKCTKRNILSQIARVFDPLGFISPCIFIAKQLLQQLWLGKWDWDDVPSETIINSWEKFKSEIPEISSIRIPRLLCLKLWNSIEIHGFCDASMKGYGGVVYFRYLNNSEVVALRIICAKSKVAPLKTVSLPRLELCAAYLLSNLIRSVIEAHKKRVSIDRVFAWSDSQITLSWIAESPHKWKIFIANRVAMIQENLPMATWHYVPSALNSADSLSRGMYPRELCAHQLWWNGPSFLHNTKNEWPPQTNLSSSLCRQIEEESKELVSLHVNSSFSLLSSLLNRYSSLSKIQRILAYVLRFTHKSNVSNSRDSSDLQPDELKFVLNRIIKHVQAECFNDIILLCKNNKPLPKPLRKLAIFVDHDGIVRVGGRLQNSLLSFESKHPILLPKHHRFNDLLVERVHIDNLHPGLKTMQNLIAKHYWILSARSSIYRCLSNCLRCFRCKPRSINPYMAPLPSCRTVSSKAFSHIAVDYAGPYKVTMTKHRGAKSTKAYVFIFVCCSTKAIHLELCSDLTSETCIAAFRRFIARRGLVTDIYSDQGTNFVGVYNILNNNARNSCTHLAIKWHFNPPAAPHFNGLAEAGVKSAKSHIKRVIGDQILTYEELLTFLSQIEAVLNSRPLTPLSDDPNDLRPLTPSHFLLTNSGVCIPEDIIKSSISLTARWNLIQRMYSDFWKRWSDEYLHTLQERNKWVNSKPNIKLNLLVLIKNELKASIHWSLGRVIAVHPGKDGVVRVVTLRTSAGTLQRPVVKICPLPGQ